MSLGFEAAKSLTLAPQLTRGAGSLPLQLVVLASLRPLPSLL